MSGRRYRRVRRRWNPVPRSRRKALGSSWRLRRRRQSTLGGRRCPLNHRRRLLCRSGCEACAAALPLALKRRLSPRDSFRGNDRVINLARLPNLRSITSPAAISASATARQIEGKRAPPKSCSCASPRPSSGEKPRPLRSLFSGRADAKRDRVAETSGRSPRWENRGGPASGWLVIPVGPYQ
jgi:hypothetical protein